MDKAHKATDKRLEVMERELAAIYREAQKGISDKAAAYFDQFIKLDEKKKALVADGKLSEDEYLQWRKNKLLYSKRFVTLQGQITGELARVNQTAAAYINDQLPDVYALNYNYVGKGVQRAVKGYSFTLIDANTVKRLATKTDGLLPKRKVDVPKDKLWNAKNMRAQVLQGILQGESIPDISKRVFGEIMKKSKTEGLTDKEMGALLKRNREAAVRSARTMVTGAENAGRIDMMHKAATDGVIMRKRWIATTDSRTRDWHRDLDGKEADIDEPFQNDFGDIMFPGDPTADGANVYNCFVGETKIASDSDVVRSYKHNYSGEIISIKTAGGVQFSCTPNHPILTPNGWVAAKLLNNGDNIIVTFGEQNVFSRVNPNINHRFPRIDTIHEFGKKFRNKWASCLGVDFHGDVATSNVEIVTHKRFLGDVRNSSGRNGIDKFLLKLSNKTLSCFGSLFEHFWSICKTSFGFIGCKCKSLPFFKCSVSHSCEHGFGTIANRDGVLTEYSINDLPADTVIDGELLDRLSCKVFLDTIVNVDVGVLSTHVYNLQTENGYYFVNSIIPQDAEKSNGIFAIAKNCRCTLGYKVVGYK